jgi:hypothetical protein
MKTVMLLLIAALGSSACRDRANTEYDVTVTKTVEHDDDFVQTRTTYETSARERLNRLNARIDELGQRADARAQDAAARLRVERDALASKLDRASQQAEAGWDAFESDVSRSFDKLESDIRASVD